MNSRALAKLARNLVFVLTVVGLVGFANPAFSARPTTDQPRIGAPKKTPPKKVTPKKKGDKDEKSEKDEKREKKTPKKTPKKKRPPVSS